MAYGRVNITGLGKTKEREYLRLISNQAAVLDVYDRTVGATDVFYDLLDGTNDYSKGQLDTTKTKATQALTIGETILTDKVESKAGFKIGQEITIQDDVNKETVTVTKADLTESTLFDHTTPIEVVGSGFTTNASARPQVLGNGWIVTVVYNSTSYIFNFYVDKHDGNGFVDLCNIASGGNLLDKWSVYSNGNDLYVLIPYLNQSMYFWKIDVLTQTNTNIYSNSTAINSSQTAIDSCSLAISDDGTKICASWSAKQSSHPNSLNIFAKQGTIGQGGSVTWGSLEQLTTKNSAGIDFTNPCVVYDNSTVSILCQYGQTNSYAIVLLTQHFTTKMFESPYIKSEWGSGSLIDGDYSTYIQSFPQAIVQRYGSHIGRLWCVWHGSDATDTKDNIRIAYSDNKGITWSPVVKLTSGNVHTQRYPTITENQNGDIFVIFCHQNDTTSGYIETACISYINDTWGSISVTSGNSTSSGYSFPSACNNHDFEKPIVVFFDQPNARIALYGKYTITALTPHLEVTALTKAYKLNALVYRSNVVLDTVTKTMKIGNFVDDAQNIPLLNSDVRYNITPESPSNEIVAWVDHEKDAGYTVDAQLSIVNDSENETYISMTKNTTETDTTHEDEFVGATGNKGNNATVKFTLTRTDTGIDKSITKVLGAIGE